MRILHTLNDVSDRGSGIVNTAVDLAIEQAQRGHVVAVASTDGGYDRLLERFGVRHMVVYIRPRRVWHLVSLFRALLEMRQILVKFKPDIVHAHMRTGVIAAWVWSRIFRFKLISHAHNIHESETVVMGLADRVIAVSRSVAATLEKQGIARHKLRVVLNRTLRTARQPGLAQICGMILRRPSIVSVAGMFHRKGIAELITAFDIAGARYPNAHLYLVGDGPERGLFEEQARLSNVADRIHFELFQRAPQAYMINADIFVLASRRESFGNVLIEAREASCAIIASDVDGIAEALDGGRCGYLVPAGDPPALADALCRLLGNADARAELKREAVIGIENFDVRSFANEIDAIYEEVSHTARRPRMSKSVVTKPW